MNTDRLLAADRKIRDELLAERDDAGHWIGRLSDSALSTATAVSALSVVLRQTPRDSDTVRGPETFREQLLRELIFSGIRYLVAGQNEDGGWGDTDRSYSNISTTMLVRAALRLADAALGERDVPAEAATTVDRAEAYVAGRGGVDGLRRRYGRDKTFAVPILTNAAIAGLVDWREVAPLPFEAACVPQSLYRFCRLPVVSYAIPALVAVGQARFFHRRPGNPLVRCIRTAAVKPSLRVLERMQPASGGFLEAVPLTSFVVMSLASVGRADHPVVRRGLRFLVDSMRSDGGWPIDTNLAVWNTTMALAGLGANGDEPLPTEPVEWLLECQQAQRHPFTGAAPGGWAWTDSSGGVPDADDTAGALLALARYHAQPTVDEDVRTRIDRAARAGVGWLLDLQNRDGGWPTFCRGWGTLPFDRSGTDLSAHAIRAADAWRCRWRESTDPPKRKLLRRIDRAIDRGFDYLRAEQRGDGSWIPLWFGNQDRPEEENPVLGTARVLAAWRDLRLSADPEARQGIDWLSSAQNADGGWGSRTGGSSVEETALALDALISAPGHGSLQVVTDKGLEWLVERIEKNGHRRAAPIGYYFAKLWYYEDLYPLTLSAAALGRAVARAHQASSDSSLKL